MKHDNKKNIMNNWDDLFASEELYLKSTKEKNRGYENMFNSSLSTENYTKPTRDHTYLTDNALYISIETPGYSSNDIKVSYDKLTNTLYVKGSRTNQRTNETHNITYSSPTLKEEVCKHNENGSSHILELSTLSYSVLNGMVEIEVKRVSKYLIDKEEIEKRENSTEVEIPQKKL